MVKIKIKVHPKRGKKLPKSVIIIIVYVNLSDSSVLTSYEEAIQSKDAKRQLKAMNSEIQSLEVNKTQTIIVDESINNNVIDLKWIYQMKSNGSYYKARVVAKG